MHNVAHKFRILKKYLGPTVMTTRYVVSYRGSATRHSVSSSLTFWIWKQKTIFLGDETWAFLLLQLGSKFCLKKVSAALQRFGEQAEFKIQGSLNHSLFKIMEKFSSAKLMKYLPISRISTWNRSNSAKWKPGMLQIKFGKEFAGGEGHIHGNLSKHPQCEHTSIRIKKKKKLLVLPFWFKLLPLPSRMVWSK